jgi:hypothetical protein
VADELKENTEVWTVPPLSNYRKGAGRGKEKSISKTEVNLRRWDQILKSGLAFGFVVATAVWILVSFRREDLPEIILQKNISSNIKSDDY